MTGLHRNMVAMAAGMMVGGGFALVSSALVPAPVEMSDRRRKRGGRALDEFGGMSDVAESHAQHQQQRSGKEPERSHRAKVTHGS